MALIRPDRRLFAGSLAAAALVRPGHALAAEPQPWLDYEARLRRRLDDAGGGIFLPSFEAGLIEENNRERRATARSRLTEDPELKIAARAHAADMAARNYFGHVAPGSFTSFDRMGLLVRSSMGFFGENLASRRMANRAHWSAAELIREWRASPIHRANLVREGFTHIGTGVVQGRGRWFVAVAYAGQSSRLKAPAPLQLTPAAIGPALIGAWPPLYGFSVSQPHGSLESRTWGLRRKLPPELAPGAWRLRPLRSNENLISEVLWGPIIVV